MTDKNSWGGQFLSTLRFYENRHDYKLGNRYAFTAWYAQRWCSWISTSLRANAQWWSNIQGRDKRLNAAMVPTADPERRAGQRVDLLVGVNFYVRDSMLQGNRLAVEYGYPVHQRLDGPQLETDHVLTLGWQFAF